MLYVIKIIIAALIIVMVTEISRLNTQLGGLIESLPLISLISFVWVYWDSQDITIIANLSLSTFWYVLATLPLFYILPILLYKGIGFYISLFLSIFITLPGYFIVSKLINT